MDESKHAHWSAEWCARLGDVCEAVLGLGIAFSEQMGRCMDAMLARKSAVPPGRCALSPPCGWFVVGLWIEACDR